MKLEVELNETPVKRAWRSVGTRILLSYLLVVILIGSISAIALLRLYQINALFDVLASGTVKDQALTQAILEQTLTMRYYMHRYIRTRAQQDKDNVESAQQRFQTLLVEAWDQAQAEERKSLLRQITTAEGRYTATFENIAMAIYEQETLRSNVLDVQALRIESALGSMRVGLLSNSNSNLFLYFNNAQYNFQSMRLYVNRYLLLGNEGDMTLAQAAYPQVVNALKKLQQEWDTASLEREFERAFIALEAYHAGMLEVQQNYQKLKTLTASLDSIETEIIGAAKSIEEQALTLLEQQSEAARMLVQTTRVAILSGVLVSTILALVITLFLTQSIRRPLSQIGKQAYQVAEVDLRALTAQLDSLSHGDLRLNLHITANPLPIEGEDEIWLMARAFNSIIASLHDAERAFGMMVGYLDTMARAANRVAQSQLDGEVPVHSEQDVLGLALQQMLVNLRTAYEEIADHIARLEALHEINRVLTTQRDLEQVINIVVEKAQHLLRGMGVGVILRREQKFLHIHNGSIALSDEVLTTSFSSGVNGVVHAWVAVVEPTHPVWQTLPSEVQEVHTRPLVVEGQCRGVFYLLRMQTTPIPQACLDFIANLVEHIQIAVEYIELIEHLEQRVAERTAELHAQKEEVKRFAYIVSHDLRAPLVNLKGFSSELRESMREFHTLMAQASDQIDPALREQIRSLLDEDVREALEFIETSVSRMDRFINALLKLSRLGRQELHLEMVDVNLVVRNTLEALSHQLKERQVTLEVGPLPVVLADRTAMEQIIGNLLDNAVKYLRHDRPGFIRVTAEETADRFIFHIEDNGRGIAAEDMDKVFMPFRRLGVQDTSGEGMGLPYVQTLVRRHGGEITCQSVLGQGTTFSFYIAKSQ